MQTLNRRCVLRFRVTDNDIITGRQKAVRNFSFGAEGLAGTRRTENQTIGVFQQLAVHHDEVVGQGVDTVVQRLFMFNIDLIEFSTLRRRLAPPLIWQ